jgi:hypothetical protein
VVIHAIKHLAGIPEKIQLLPPSITNAIRSLKTEILKEKTVSLDLEETLIALSISATTNPAAQLAIEQLKELRTLRGAHDPHPHPRGRGRPEEAGGQPHQRPELFLEESVYILNWLLVTRYWLLVKKLQGLGNEARWARNRSSK